ncbi:MAG: hypothetical protein QOE90_3257 [Thermoplasmata archaeon]|jgi:hypothetical protein|nr:hypothetical protein [Thermoplasmata archaeon]
MSVRRLVELQWDALGAIGLVAALLALGMALFLLRIGHGNENNRRLALVLAAEGIHIGVFNGMLAFVVNGADALPMLRLGLAALAVLPFAYLAFLAGLDSPLVKPLRARPAQLGLLALGLAAGAAVAFRADLFFQPQDLVDPASGATVTVVVPTLKFFMLEAVAYVIDLFALVASLEAYLRAPTGVSRGRARAFAIAFGVRDAVSAAFLVYVTLVAQHVPTLTSAADRLVHGYDFVSFIVLLYVPLIAYGIVKYQLFDIDLKIKRGVRVSAIAGIFLAVFFVVAQIAQNYLQQYGVVAGGAAAGLLLFALNPLQKAAERVADKAMPQTRATPEYLAFKKLEVYRAAFEGVLEDGRVSAKERAMLIGLRGKLGISEVDASALEEDVRGMVFGGQPMAA